MVLCGVFFLLVAGQDPAPSVASQIHLSLSLNDTEMVVTWSTPQDAWSAVSYGLAREFPHRQVVVEGSSSLFVDNGTLHHTQYIHRVVLSNLQPLARYTYRVWNGTSFSDLFGFTHVGGSNWSPRFTIIGDFGLENARSLNHLIQEAQAGVSDILVHVGDFAYDMYEDNATVGDIWFGQIQPIASTLPYMVCPGNHEGMYDFLNYRSRFSMPFRDSAENLFSSWNAGPTHWIAYDTEVYFEYDAMDGHGGVHRNFGPYPDVAKQQLEFVENDLKRAVLNRQEQPWIIAYGHRPMYCSDDDDDDCIQMRNLWKHDLEQLFFQYGVDLVIEAHQHSYERLWPVFNGTVLNGTSSPYENPRAPVHIVSGSAGCRENLDTFSGPLGEWSAIRVSEYGYGHLTVHNSTHVHWEQLRVDDFQVIDSVWITKDELRPSFAKYPQVVPPAESVSKQDALIQEPSPAVEEKGVPDDGEVKTAPVSFWNSVGWVFCSLSAITLLVIAVKQIRDMNTDHGMYHTI